VDGKSKTRYLRIYAAQLFVFVLTVSTFDSMSAALSAQEEPSGIAVKGMVPHRFVADARAASANAFCSEESGSF